MITYKGYIRIYYNIANEYPRVACLGNSEGTWEIACVEVVVCSGVNLKSHYNPDAGKGDARFWLGCRALVSIDAAGVAILTPFEEKG